jgi:hypothetical protein
LFRLTLTTRIFVIFGDVIATRETSFSFIRKNLQNSFTADAENFDHLLKDKHVNNLVLRATLQSVSGSVLATVG